MPPTNLQNPEVGEPTKKQKFADLVIEWIVYLYNLIRGTGGSGNLPVNGGFENDADSDGVPDGWTLTLFSGGLGAFDTTTSIEGKQSFKFTHPGGSSPNGGGYLLSGLDANDFIEINPYKDVSLSWWHMVDVATNLGVKVELLWYKEDQSVASTPSSTLYNSTTNPTSWRAFCGTATPPTDARLMKVKLTGGTQNPDPGGIAHVWFDDVVIFVPCVLGKSDLFTNTAGTTFRVPRNVTWIEVEGLGGGGGGARYVSTNGGGNGAGGVCAVQWIPVCPGRLLTITPGIGGAGKTGSDGNGLAGGASVVTDEDGTILFTTPGGNPGQTGGAAPSGAGVAPSFDAVNRKYIFGSNGPNSGAIDKIAGNGMSATLAAPTTTISPATTRPPLAGRGGQSASANGTNYGGGGSGGAISPANGGNGAQGYILLRY